MLASLAQLPETRAKFAAGLMELGYEVFPSAANFLLVRSREGGASAIYRALGRRGFLVRRCDSFHGLAPLNSYLRLAVRRPHENEQLLSTLEQVTFTRAAA
jgi:histidinol-phosphate/aromatic aminotransferase/cobyric acid decarboxylase-like protein